MQLTGKVALITGAASGIGKAVSYYANKIASLDRRGAGAQGSKGEDFTKNPKSQIMQVKCALA